MAMVDGLLPEFDHEMTLTRKLLERVPDDRLGWKPHAKSMSVGGLATHLSNLPWWGEVTLAQADLDLASFATPAEATSRAQLLDTFDRHVTAARAALSGRSDAELMAPWTLKRAGQTILTMPKASVWRSFVISHVVHHRGQLSVYLRLLDVPVPSIYGPSADEGGL
jgi:uncharacterized damage-inducible protein DinB